MAEVNITLFCYYTYSTIAYMYTYTYLFMPYTTLLYYIHTLYTYYLYVCIPWLIYTYTYTIPYITQAPSPSGRCGTWPYCRPTILVHKVCSVYIHVSYISYVYIIVYMCINYIILLRSLLICVDRKTEYKYDRSINWNEWQLAK